MQIAKAIAELRAANGFSQEDLAARLFVSRELVSKWETGARRPDWLMIEKIAAVFGVSPASIADKSDLVQKELEKSLPADSRLSADELALQLNAFLRALPETEADIFIDRYYFLKDVAEIADLFRIGKNHVRSLLSRTRKKLKKYMKEVENEKHEII